MTAPGPGRARTFWPVVLVGIAASAVAAVGGYRPMMQVQERYLAQLGPGAVALDETVKDLQLAGNCALVMLACWGVILVTRHVARRVLAGIVAVAAVGALLTLGVGGLAKHDDVVIELGAPIEYTGWFWLVMVTSVIALVAALAALRLAPAWPEMGSRYDAPSAKEGGSTDVRTEERTSLDLWKSMDEGDDPTDDESD